MFRILKKIHNEKGMSLIEILIVLGIIAAAMAAILNTVFTSGNEAKKKQADAEINKLAGFIKLYKQDEGKYPTSDEGLEAIVGKYIEEVPLDPWKNEYIYESPSSSGKKFDICSPGPDDETEDDDICYQKKDSE